MVIICCSYNLLPHFPHLSPLSFIHTILPNLFNLFMCEREHTHKMIMIRNLLSMLSRDLFHCCSIFVLVWTSLQRFDWFDDWSNNQQTQANLNRRIVNYVSVFVHYRTHTFRRSFFVIFLLLTLSLSLYRQLLWDGSVSYAKISRLDCMKRWHTPFTLLFYFIQIFLYFRVCCVAGEQIWIDSLGLIENQNWSLSALKGKSAIVAAWEEFNLCKLNIYLFMYLTLFSQIYETCLFLFEQPVFLNYGRGYRIILCCRGEIFSIGSSIRLYELEDSTIYP